VGWVWFVVGFGVEIWVSVCVRRQISLGGEGWGSKHAYIREKLAALKNEIEAGTKLIVRADSIS